MLARAEADELALSEFGSLRRGTLSIRGNVRPSVTIGSPVAWSCSGGPIRRSRSVSLWATPPRLRRPSRVGRRN